MKLMQTHNNETKGKQIKTNNREGGHYHVIHLEKTVGCNASSSSHDAPYVPDFLSSGLSS